MGSDVVIYNDFIVFFNVVNVNLCFGVYLVDVGCIDEYFIVFVVFYYFGVVGYYLYISFCVSKFYGY